VIDQIFNPALRDAIAKSQADHGMPQTGRLDEPRRAAAQ